MIYDKMAMEIHHGRQGARQDDKQRDNQLDIERQGKERDEG